MKRRSTCSVKSLCSIRDFCLTLRHALRTIDGGLAYGGASAFVGPGGETLRQYLRQLERKPAESMDISERRDRATSPYFAGEIGYFFGFLRARGFALFLLRM